MYKLYLDDLRPPPDQTWVVARSVAAAEVLVNTYGLPHTMSLDHDLGDGVDAPVFMNWLIKSALEKNLSNGKDGRELDALVRVTLYVHSHNPVGKQNLLLTWSSFKKFVNACKN